MRIDFWDLKMSDLKTQDRVEHGIKATAYNHDLGDGTTQTTDLCIDKKAHITRTSYLGDSYYAWSQPKKCDGRCEQGDISQEEFIYSPEGAMLVNNFLAEIGHKN